MLMVRELSEKEILEIAKKQWAAGEPEDIVKIVQACFQAAIVKQQFQD